MIRSWFTIRPYPQASAHCPGRKCSIFGSTQDEPDVNQWNNSIRCRSAVTALCKGCPMTDGDPTTERGGPASWWKVTAIVTAVLVTLTCGVIVWSFMPPVVYFPFFALAASVLLGLGGVWLILSLIGWMKYKTLRLSTIAPVIVLVTGALVTLSVPSHVAFA